MGLNFKLDVGTLRLDLQVACQRYRQQFLDAKTSFSEKLANVRASAKMFGARSAYALAA
jgi:hypothetical protein